jgi:hypothetical protein
MILPNPAISFHCMALLNRSSRRVYALSKIPWCKKMRLSTLFKTFTEKVKNRMKKSSRISIFTASVLLLTTGSALAMLINVNPTPLSETGIMLLFGTVLVLISIAGQNKLKKIPKAIESGSE